MSGLVTQPFLHIKQLRRVKRKVWKDDLNTIPVLWASPLPHREGRVWSTTDVPGPVREQHSVTWYVAAPNTHLTTKCEIGTSCFFFPETVGGCFCCSADWIDYDKSFCYACLPSGVFQWVIGLHNSIVLVVLLSWRTR